MLDLINVSYDTQIPNNVGLSSDKRVLKALEKWHPGYINWWNDLITYKFQQSAANLYGGEVAFNIHPTALPWMS
ncbi:MAG: hypothetical protein PF443_06960, partial [Allgaiera sp.]|nr:hypothetical protein [Allgaiera sp.]